MAAPQQTVPGCPPGLEYLTQVDQLLVNQQVELLESEFILETHRHTCVCVYNYMYSELKCVYSILHM